MLDVSTIILSYGAHATRAQGVCLLEAVAWCAGEEHSDHPACCCPVLAGYGRALNDYAPQWVRDRMRALVPRLVGTRADIATERRRAYILADAAVRVVAPLALDAVARPEQAATLRALPEIVDDATAAAAARAAAAAVRTAEAARAAWAAAEAAEAAWAAGAEGAEGAAEEAAWAAARAARAAALAARAGDTAWLAALGAFERAVVRR